MMHYGSRIFCQFPLFDRLSDKVGACLRSKGRLRSYERGETISLQNDPARTLKLVMEGCVKLYRLTPDGTEAILSTLERGQSFDEIPALNDGLSPASAEAMSASIVMHLDLGAICLCENASREISKAVLSAASDHMDNMIKHIEQLKVKTGLQRLSDFLVDSCEGQDGMIDLELPYDKTVLAGKLGMQPESLSRAFRSLKSLGVVSNRRKIHIDNAASLRRQSQSDYACV